MRHGKTTTGGITCQIYFQSGVFLTMLFFLAENKFFTRSSMYLYLVVTEPTKLQLVEYQHNEFTQGMPPDLLIKQSELPKPVGLNEQCHSCKQTVIEAAYCARGTPGILQKVCTDVHSTCLSVYLDGLSSTCIYRTPRPAGEVLVPETLKTTLIQFHCLI